MRHSNRYQPLDHRDFVRIDHVVLSCNSQDEKTCRLILVVQLISPHKVKEENLQVVLGRNGVDVKQIFQRRRIPQEEKAKAVNEAEQAVAEALAQTFDYMVRNGVDYGLMVTGEAYVFLHIPDSRLSYNLGVLEYYLFSTKATNAPSADDIPRTLVGMIMALCLMASSAPSKSIGERVAMRKGLYPIEKVSGDGSGSEGEADRGTQDDHPPGAVSPISNRKRKLSSGCKDDTKQSSDSGSGSGEDNLNSATRPREHKNLDESTAPDEIRITETRRREYCTHGCLLGILHGTTLDNKCPNVRFHPPTPSRQHTVDAVTVVRLTQQQLTIIPEYACVPLNERGARGALFKIWLVSHGYVFAAKGTVEAPEVEPEIYKHLSHLQGAIIPVYLGYFQLKQLYYLPLNGEISYFALMSYAGERVKNLNDYDPQVRKMTKAIKSAGVRHGDIRFANILLDSRTQELMMIDFDQASFVKRAPGKEPSRSC